MAARFWVGGTGNWSDTAHWALTSGGAGGLAVPTTADQVTFNASSGSGTVTFDVNPNVNTISGEAGSIIFNPLTSLITISGSGTSNALCGPGRYYDILLTGSPIVNMLTSAISTCHHLTALNASNFRFEQNDTTLVVSGTLTLKGRSITDRLTVVAQNGNSSNRRVRIQAAAIDLAYVDFQGTTASGAAIPWTGTSLGNLGSGNVQITTAVARTLYWVGGTGSYNQVAHWALSSGGSGGVDIPLFQDSVIFDDNSFSGLGQTVTLNVVQLGQNVTFNTTKNPVLGFTVAIGANGNGNNNWPLEFDGPCFGLSFTMSAGMTTTGTSASLCVYAMATLVTLDTKGIVLTPRVFNSGRAEAAAGAVTRLLSDIVTNGALVSNIVVGQEFDANGFNVTCVGITLQRSTLRLGTGTWVTSGSFTNPNVNASTKVIPSASGTMRFVNSSASQLTFDSGNTGSSGGVSFADIEYAGAGTGGWLVVRSQTQLDLKVTTAAIIVFTQGTTQTINSMTAVGGTTTATKFTLKSSLNGTRWNISKPSGVVTVSFVSLQDSNATGGATFNDSPQSMSVSNNLGWNFNPYTSSKSATATPAARTPIRACAIRRAVTVTPAARPPTRAAALRRTSAATPAATSARAAALRRTSVVTPAAVAPTRATALRRTSVATPTAIAPTRACAIQRSSTVTPAASVRRQLAAARSLAVTCVASASRTLGLARAAGIGSAASVARNLGLHRLVATTGSVAVATIIAIIRRLNMRSQMRTTFGGQSSDDTTIALRGSANTTIELRSTRNTTLAGRSSDDTTIDGD